MEFLKFLFFVAYITSGIVVMRWSIIASDMELEAQSVLSKILLITKNGSGKIANREMYLGKTRKLVFCFGLYCVLKGINWLFALDNSLINLGFGIYATSMIIGVINLMRCYKPLRTRN